MMMSDAPSMINPDRCSGRKIAPTNDRSAAKETRTAGSFEFMIELLRAFALCIFSI